MNTDDRVRLLEDSLRRAYASLAWETDKDAVRRRIAVIKERIVAEKKSAKRLYTSANM